MPKRFIEPSVFYCRHGLSRLKTLDTVKGRAVIDAGGCIGESALIFAELAPSAVYTFEPVPDNFALLKRTLELNRITNAVAENIALGAKAGEATMSVNRSNIGASTIAAEKSKGELITVPVRALGDYVSEHGLQAGLIKTGLEGAEPDFIAGASFAYFDINLVYSRQFIG